MTIDMGSLVIALVGAGLLFLARLRWTDAVAYTALANPLKLLVIAAMALTYAYTFGVWLTQTQIEAALPANVQAIRSAVRPIVIPTVWYWGLIVVIYFLLIVDMAKAVVEHARKKATKGNL